MADFYNREPADTYKSILNIGGEPNETLTSSLKAIEDGRGNDSALSLSTTTVQALRLHVDSIVIDANAITGATIDADSNTVSNLEVDNLKSGVLDTDISGVSASDDTLASAKAIKTYVDAQVAGADTITELSDTTITSVGDNEVFQYDNASSRWINQTLAEAGIQSTLAFGISDTNIPIFTSGVADNDFLRVDGTSIEGRSASEVLSDIGAQASGSYITGSGSLSAQDLTDIGNLSGTNTGDQATGISDGNVLTANDVVVDNDFLRIDGTEVEGRSAAEVLSDIGAAPLASPTFTGSFTSPGIDDNANAISITINSDEEVGIGETDPDHLLHLTGTNPQICIEESSTEFVRIGVDATSEDMCLGWDDADDMHFGVFSSTTDTTLIEHMTIKSDGRVGIGTNTPDVLLDMETHYLYGWLSAGGSVTTSTSNANVIGSGTAFLTDFAIGDPIKIGAAVFTVVLIAADNAMVVDSNGVNNDSGQSIYLAPDLLRMINGDSLHALTVTTAGDVIMGRGIQTDKLTIGKTINTMDSGAEIHVATAENYPMLLDGTHASQTQLLIRNTNAGDPTVGYFTSTGADQYWTHGIDEDDFHLKFSPGADLSTPKVTFQTDGNVGIGVTDPDTTLEVLDTTTQLKLSYDADSFATLTVADASHTTLATGESGNLTLDVAGDIVLNADGGDVTIKDGATTYGSFGASTPFQKFTKVILSEANMNDLHNTAITLVAAAGANNLIIPGFFTCLVTRDGSTAQSNSSTLYMSWDGVVTTGKEVGYVRNFMKDEGGSRTYHVHGMGYSAESWDTADPSNKPLQVKLSAAITADSIDSMTIITHYWIADVS